jgi:hypothetical protein
MLKNNKILVNNNISVNNKMLVNNNISVNNKMLVNNFPYRDLIILYCPEKVGSTSIVSSIRISAGDKFMVFHTHEDKIADIVNQCNIIRVKDLIMNNKVINPSTNEFRKIYLIDIFRTPIERKISCFFQKISEIHFNNSELNISKYPIEKIFKRFNDLFVHYEETDYFNEMFGCKTIENFDFENKFILKEIDNVFYIKLRLQDSKHWGNILTQILKIPIHMIYDYQTVDKNIGELYNKFKNGYKLPYNYYKLIEQNKMLSIYLNHDEKKKYIDNWFEKITHNHIPFTKLEYEFYCKISGENKFYCANTSNLHYNDDGCVCNICRDKRKIVQYNLINNIEQKIHIRHLYDQNYDNNIFIKLFPTNDYEKSYDLIINLINS